MYNYKNIVFKIWKDKKYFQVPILYTYAKYGKVLIVFKRAIRLFNVLKLKIKKIIN